MLRVVLILIAGLALMFPAFAQDDEREETDESPVISLKRGEAEALEILAAFLLEGEKVELSFRSDYYANEGSLSLEEGRYSLLAVGIGGDTTTYIGEDATGVDLMLTAFNERCFRALTYVSAGAFRITCPEYTVRFEINSHTQYSLLMISRLDA
ncbi:MAG: hypothetical protein OXF32_11195 [Anaerolineaceae bacterium]|nr:hypothetical protein [Anaerolineaceae bacterium]